MFMPSRNSLTNTMKFILAILFTLIASAVQSIAAQKPNVVFILADDLGWSDLACYGSTYTRRRT